MVFAQSSSIFLQAQCNSPSLFYKFEVSWGGLNCSLKNYGFLCDTILFFMCTHVYSLASHHQILFKCALTYLHAGMDFNDTPFEVTMEAGNTLVTAGIPIVDDEINEAEEVFVVVMEVVSNTTNPVEFTTNTTVCRIPASDRKCTTEWLHGLNWVTDSLIQVEEFFNGFFSRLCITTHQVL